jgi:hypothetical protein
MTIDQLTDFYALTAKSDREAQKQADCFLVQAINLSLDGDAMVSGEMLLEANRIIAGTLNAHYDSQRIAADEEAEESLKIGLIGYD